jgi:hypothetical protein
MKISYVNLFAVSFKNIHEIQECNIISLENILIYYILRIRKYTYS